MLNTAKVLQQQVGHIVIIGQKPAYKAANVCHGAHLVKQMKTYGNTNK